MKRERGFAMLLVFVMAAAVAIMLYNELPRVAFEAQRNKEELLIQRGEQYSRAIQLYVRKFKRYPAKIEDLEETNQIRFLRRRYNDPMTGKSEWRVVHIGPGGVFTDSLVHKPPSLKDKEEQKAANTFTYEAPTIGSTIQPGQGAPGFAPVRPSERGGMRYPGQMQPGDATNPQQQPQPGYPATGVVAYPNQQPGGYNPNLPQPGAYPAPPGVPGLPAGMNPQQPYPQQQPGAYPQQQPGVYPQQPGVYPQPYPQQPGAYPQQQPGIYPQQPGFNPTQLGRQPFGQPQQQPGVYPGQPANSQTGGVSPYPYSIQPNAQGAPAPFPQPGTTLTPGGQPGQNQAMNMIQQILTTPRAGGPAGSNQPMGGMQIAGGIAGVASTVERTGIKIYNEKEKYNEWEFLYDLTQDKTGMGAAMGGAGVQQQQQGTQGPPQGPQAPGTQNPFGQPPGNTSPFTGGAPGFGQQPQPANRR